MRSRNPTSFTGVGERARAGWLFRRHGSSISKRSVTWLSFVSADTPSALDTNLANLDGASLLNLYQDAELPKELKIRKKKVIEALRVKAGRWVLLLDNVDSKKARDAVKQLFSDLAGGRFLVTTRREDWPSATVQNYSSMCLTAAKPYPASGHGTGNQKQHAKNWLTLKNWPTSLSTCRAGSFRFGLLPVGSSPRP
jgi:hypothetical protein